MEIASTSSALPTDQSYKIKDVGCKAINCSLLPINPKSDIDEPQKLSRTGRYRKERCDVVMAAPKKRKHCDEEKPPEKRQKKTTEALKSKFTEPVDAKAITAKFTKPEQSITALFRHRETKTNLKVRRLIHEKSFTNSRIRLHDTKTKPKVITTKPSDKIENQNHSFKDLIAKAREKLQEKRKIDHRNAYIASQRIAARLALNQMVKTVDFDEHLKYHTELEQLGCDFIRDQVSCLNKFNLLSRSDYYIDGSNSVLEKKEITESGEHIQ